MSNTGIIRALKFERGFGFIRSEGTDYFFHMSGCKEDFFDLQPGDTVRFHTEETDRGVRAVDVERIYRHQKSPKST